MTATTIVAHGGALDDWLERRRALGLDGRDEVWDGIYHVTPHAHASHGRLAALLIARLDARAAAAGLVPLTEFNLGNDHDFRVPDAGFVHRDQTLELYLPTAVVVVEIVSAGDASREKIPFYLDRGVQEVWLIDPGNRQVEIRCAPSAPASGALGLSVSDLENLLGW